MPHTGSESANLSEITLRGGRLAAVGGSLAAVPSPEMPDDPALRAELDDLEDSARGLDEEALAANTHRAYETAWKDFEKFCDRYRLPMLPTSPEVVRWFVAHLARQERDDDGTPQFTVTSIRQKLAGVRWKHLEEGHLDPTGHAGVSRTLKGLARLRQERPDRKRPLLKKDVLTVLSRMTYDEYPQGVSAARDRVAIWLGWAAALRRSEVAALTVGRIVWHMDDGLWIDLGKSKTNQDGSEVNKLTIEYGETPLTCVPCAMRHWFSLVAASRGPQPRQNIMRLLYDHQTETHICLDRPDPTLAPDGSHIPGLEPTAPLLRATYRNWKTATIRDEGVSGDALHAMLLTRLTEAGFQPQYYGWHSLRAGVVTELRRQNATAREIMPLTRHKNENMITEVYDREWNPSAQSPLKKYGVL